MRLPRSPYGSATNRSAVRSEPPYLHLIIFPAHKLQIPIDTPSHDIPSPVHAATPLPIRVGDKSLRRPIGTPVSSPDHLSGPQTPNSHRHAIARYPQSGTCGYPAPHTGRRQIAPPSDRNPRIFT